MLEDFKEVLTGDHAQNINAITRQQEKKLLLEALPKKTHDLLALQIRRYDGRNASEAEQWLKDIEEWLGYNDLSMTGVFDLLLVDEAAVLWRNFRKDSTTKEEAKSWFKEIFFVKKSFFDFLMELTNVKQNDEERFATFEIRVRELVDKVLDSGMSKESIVSELIGKRAKNSGFRDALIARPNISMNETRELAKLYESREQQLSNTGKFHVAEVRQTYSRVVQKQQYRPSYQNNNIYRKEQVSAQPIVEENQINNRLRNNTQEYSSQSTREPNRRDPPKFSMKDIARRVYNQSKGIPPPKDQYLRPGQCYCCGGHDHIRVNCPLKDKCLICGKHGHSFRQCSLLNVQHRRPQRHVMCIHDEELDDSQNEDLDHELEDKKNHGDPIVHISSVGSNQ